MFLNITGTKEEYKQMAEMPKRSVRLPQDFWDYIEKKIESGEYHSVSDYIFRRVHEDILADKLESNVSQISTKTIENIIYSPEYENLLLTLIDKYHRTKE